MIRAIIFDVDGTLVDSNHLHALAWQQALAHFGKQVEYEQVRNQIGKGGDQTLPVFLTADEIERFGKELDEYKSRLYRTRYMAKVRPFPKVRELFEGIRRRGQRIALATSAGKDELQHNLDLLNVRDLVEATTSEGDAQRTKPFPDVFLAALRKLGEPPRDEVAVVGDSPYDAEAAAQVPLLAVGVLCGGYAEQQLRDAGCAAVYRDPADLLEHYEQSPLGQ